MGSLSNLIVNQGVRQCPRPTILALQDTLNVISGKWKLPIIASVLYGMTRFKDLQENLGTITPRMLSKELKELEVNGIIERTVYDSKPVLIEYTLTESGKKLIGVLDAMLDWGQLHRERTMGKGQAV